MQFIAEVAAEIWFDAKVPSPTELFRNWIFGSLRCGKKMKVKGGLPGLANLFFDKKGKVVLAAFGGMLGAPLMYWSMAQTTFKALDTWSTIINTQALCENPEAHVIMRGGHARIQFEGTGGIPFYTEVYDPFNYGTPLSGAMDFPLGFQAAWASGTCTNLHPTITAQFAVRMFVGGSEDTAWHPMSIGPGEVKTFSVYNQADNHGPCQVQVKLDNDLPGILMGVDTIVDCFAGNMNRNDPNNQWPSGPGEPEPTPYDTCELLYEAP